MTEVGAEQLIYMRVESLYSPQGRAGYQTVWRSAGITPETAAAIEQRVQCFQPDSPERRRVQFFTLANGATIVTRTVVVDSDPEIVDSSRRPGAFCVHSLVLRQVDFAKLDHNPFAVLDAAPYLDSPHQMVAAFGRATGEAPRCELQVIPPRPLAAAWRGDDARRLTALAWSAEAMRRDRHAVLMTGASNEIEDALRVAFALLPRTRRPACSFNSFVERCPNVPGEYWTWGAGSVRRMSEVLAAAGGRGTIEVDAAAGRVGEASVARDANLYLDWLERSLTARAPAELLAEAATVDAIVAALAGDAIAVPAMWDPRAVGELFAWCEETLLDHLAATARPVLGAALARYLGGYLLRCGPDLEAAFVLSALSPSRDTAAAALARLAVIQLKDLHVGVPPQDADLRQLRKLAAATRNWVLLHWTSTLGGSRDEKARDQALACMSSEEFRVAAALLGQPIAAVDFVGGHHLRALLRHDRIAALGDAALVDLVEAILRAGGGGELGALISLVPRLGAAAVARLERAAQGRRGAEMAADFKLALDSRAPDARRQRGWLGRMR